MSIAQSTAWRALVIADGLRRLGHTLDARGHQNAGAPEALRLEARECPGAWDGQIGSHSAETVKY